jgi:DNA-binding NarL/FixJ family response regulator
MPDADPRVLVVEQRAAGTSAAWGVRGLRVVGQTTAAKARSAIARNEPDVVVVVWQDGQDMLTVIRDITSLGRAEVVVTGGNDDADALLAAIEAGARGYLPKSQPREQLLRAVRVVSEGEPAFPRRLFGPLLDRLAVRGRERYVAQTRLQSLTPRQRAVLEQLLSGASSIDIAAALEITPQTTRKHIQMLFRRLGVHSRVEAVAMVLRSGMANQLVTAREGAERLDRLSP